MPVHGVGAIGLSNGCKTCSRKDGGLAKISVSCVETCGNNENCNQLKSVEVISPTEPMCVSHFLRGSSDRAKNNQHDFAYESGAVSRCVGHVGKLVFDFTFPLPCFFPPGVSILVLSTKL